MPTTKLDPKRTSINLASWLKAHNEKHPYQDRKKRIRGGALLTAKCILKDFIKAYAQGKTTQGYYETSTSLIAEYTMQSRSAVRRQIKHLEEQGFIVDIQREGFGNNYKIKFVNEFFEYITEQVDEIKDSGQQVSEEMTEQMSEKLMQMYSGRPQDYLQGLSRGFLSPTKERRNTS